MTARRKGVTVRVCGLAVGLTSAAAWVTAAPLHAEEPSLHRVTYSVSARNPFYADIYYRETAPPTWADYSHNPYQFSPKVESAIAPGKPWVREVLLADPREWAMVAVSSGNPREQPLVHCELAIDGVVVYSNDGPKGAVCSLRSW